MMPVCSFQPAFKAGHLSVVAHAWIQRGREQGVRTPLKNQKAIGFHSNTGPDPLKSHKATNVGPSLEELLSEQI